MAEVNEARSFGLHPNNPGWVNMLVQLIFRASKIAKSTQLGVLPVILKNYFKNFCCMQLNVTTEYSDLKAVDISPIRYRNYRLYAVFTLILFIIWLTTSSNYKNIIVRDSMHNYPHSSPYQRHGILGMGSDGRHP